MDFRGFHVPVIWVQTEGVEGGFRYSVLYVCSRNDEASFRNFIKKVSDPQDSYFFALDSNDLLRAVEALLVGRYDDVVSSEPWV